MPTQEAQPSVRTEAVRELLQALHQEGSTICMVTHDPRCAEHADRKIHLFDGRLSDGGESGYIPEAMP